MFELPFAFMNEGSLRTDGTILTVRGSAQYQVEQTHVHKSQPSHKDVSPGDSSNYQGYTSTGSLNSLKEQKAMSPLSTSAKTTGTSPL